MSLLDEGHDVVIVDNLSNSHRAVLDAIQLVAGRSPYFEEFDVCDTDCVAEIIRRYHCDAVIHFAAMKHVGESTRIPLDYYGCNIGGLTSLLSAAQATELRKIVFSSSGSVYGSTDRLPIPESHPHNPTNPYSQTKSVSERILRDLCISDPSWRVVALRYFNPAGAHESGLLGEWCLGPPSNLLPVVVEASLTEHPRVTVHGDDFDTPDGSGVRDYIHVMDVAASHLAALDLLDSADFGSDGLPYDVFNVGRGHGVSVFELIKTMENITGRSFRVDVGPRRAGDVAALYGDTTKAATGLGLTDYRDFRTICEDAWRFRTHNPDGYQAVAADRS